MFTSFFLLAGKKPAAPTGAALNVYKKTEILFSVFVRKSNSFLCI